MCVKLVKQLWEDATGEGSNRGGAQEITNVTRQTVAASIVSKRKRLRRYEKVKEKRCICLQRSVVLGRMKEFLQCFV